MLSLRLPQRSKFILLCVLSGVFSAAFVAMDVYYLNTYLNDPLIYGFLTEWIGLLFSFVLMLIFSIPIRKDKPLGTILDPTFRGLALPRGKPLLYIIAAGLSASFSTFSYFILTFVGDPSSILPLSRLVIVYLLVAELFYEKDTPTLVEVVSISIILIGVFFVSFSGSSLGIIEALLTLGPYNMGLAFYTYFQKLARDYREKENVVNDSLNLRIWSLLFLTIFLTIFTIPLFTPEQLSITLIYFFDTFTVIFIIIDMSLAFFSYVFYLRALGMGKMSIVNSITSISVILGIPFTLIGNFLFPGAFGVIPLDAYSWTAKALGSLLVFEGIVVLSVSQEKTFILIKVKYPCGKDLLGTLKSIKGVERVSAVAGVYDYIVKVKIRSVAKVYNLLVQKIEKIPEISEITTMTIVKEHEKI
ncbi:MAG: Lrp/AsnC ligand binding domain-containing protein [Candidatus Asgardarchaeia archaeon]